MRTAHAMHFVSLIDSLTVIKWIMCCPFKGLFTRKEGHITCFFFLRLVYKAARVIRVGRLHYLRARLTLAGGLTFSLINTPGRV